MTTSLPTPPDATASAVERMTWCVSVARFAPSKHNAQPWRFFVYDDGVVELYADATRSLPASDPDDRELTIGNGAALHTFALALRGLGVRPSVTLLPDGPDGPLARVEEAGAYEPTADDLALLSAVPARRTNRGPLDATLMPAGTPAALQRAAESEGALLQLLVAPGAQDALDALVARADESAYAAELATWLRAPGSSASDGVPARAGGVYGARFAPRAFGDPSPERVDDRPLPAVLWTAGDTQADWLRAGRALQAVLLRATVEGAAASFVNQPLEHPATRVALRREVGWAGFPQLVLRLGAGSAVPATPRRPLADLIRTA